MTAQPVRVVLIGHAGPQQFLVVIDSLDYIYQEGKELHVRLRILAGGEQIHTSISHH